MSLHMSLPMSLLRPLPGDWTCDVRSPCAADCAQDAYHALVRREREVFGWHDMVDVWPEDLEFLVTDVFGGVCVVTGGSMGGGGPALTFTRWDRTRPAKVDNLVLMTKECAKKHDQAASPFDELDAKLVSAIHRTLQMAEESSRLWRTQ